MDYRFDEDGHPYVAIPIPDLGDYIQFETRDERRERTGFHAQVRIVYATGDLHGVTLAYDTFNISRSEERARLAKQAGQSLSDMVLMSYGNGTKADGMLQLTKDLAAFCENLAAVWEERRYSLDFWAADEPINRLVRVLYPYLLEGGGTITFGPPESGKTYLNLAMAYTIAMLHDGPCDHLWRVKHGPVLFVNLERSEDSMKRRSLMVMRALGIQKSNHQLVMINARGSSLPSVLPAAKAYMRRNKGGSVFLDSISRAGYGSMNDDDNANRIIDGLNALGDTWCAIGHTARGANDHVFGSQMFDAGQDVGVQVVKERRGNVLGLALRVTKGNDIAQPPIDYIAFEFSDEDQDGESYLENIRRAKASEFPELSTSTTKTRLEQLVDWMHTVTKATTTEAHNATGFPISDVSNWFNHSGKFESAGIEGRNVFYRIREL